MRYIFLIILALALLGFQAGNVYYDDSVLTYSGNWTLLNNPNPYNGTIHYTSTVGDSATFQFTGTRFNFIYSGYSNRGSVALALDGSTVATIDEYTSSFAWQSAYMSVGFPYGSHTLTITFVGGGTYADIDALQIFDDTIPTATPTGTLTPVPTSTPTLPPFQDIPDQYQGTLHLIVLMGQSNMIGRDPPPANQPTSATVFNFGNDYRWHWGFEPIDSPAGQVDLVSGDMEPFNTLAGYGPAMSFALRLQDLRPGYLIGLIPCAKGSSSLYDWRRSLSENTLYGSCLKRIWAASTMGTLSGVLFYQGETDAQGEWTTPIYHDGWGMQFKELVNNLRGDTGKLPVVFVQIGNLPEDRFPYVSNVQQSQASVILPNVVMVSAAGLPTESDGVHLTVSSVQELGHMMADAMDGILP